MATQAHCFYCFESLSASFEGREPPSLAHVEELYNLWVKSQPGYVGDVEEDPAQMTADVEVEIEDDDDEDEDDDEISKQPHPSIPQVGQPSTRLQPPRIGHLQVASDSSSSSAMSSQSVLTDPSSTSSTTSYSSAASRSLSSSYPLFVTWNTISRHNPSHKSLRGCIGTFEAQPLQQGLQTYAITSAFDDTRFSPIPSSQLSSLSCSITLLANFTPCSDAMDWILGVHGLRILFVYRGKRYGATYLPDVAVEQGWTKGECVESLMRKAGWDGGSSTGGVARRLLRGSVSRAENTSHSRQPWEEVGDFKTIRYTGLRANATHGEWMEWKKWVES